MKALVLLALFGAALVANASQQSKRTAYATLRVSPGESPTLPIVAVQSVEPALKAPKNPLRLELSTHAHCAAGLKSWGAPVLATRRSRPVPAQSSTHLASRQQRRPAAHVGPTRIMNTVSSSGRSLKEAAEPGMLRTKGSQQPAAAVLQQLCNSPEGQLHAANRKYNTVVSAEQQEWTLCGKAGTRPMYTLKRSAVQRQPRPVY